MYGLGLWFEKVCRSQSILREANHSYRAFEPKDTIPSNTKGSLACFERLVADVSGHFLNTVDVVSHFATVKNQRGLKPLADGMEKFLSIQRLVGVTRADES